MVERVFQYPANVQEVLGGRSYPDLLSVPAKVDIVDIFRRPEHVQEVVQQAIQIGATCIWMQAGIAHAEAAAVARSHGLDVVMDMCILQEHRKRLQGRDQARRCLS